MLRRNYLRVWRPYEYQELFEDNIQEDNARSTKMLRFVPFVIWFEIRL